MGNQIRYRGWNPDSKMNLKEPFSHTLLQSTCLRMLRWIFCFLLPQRSHKGPGIVSALFILFKKIVSFIFQTIVLLHLSLPFSHSELSFLVFKSITFFAMNCLCICVWAIGVGVFHEYINTAYLVCLMLLLCTIYVFRADYLGLNNQLEYSYW